MRVYQLNEMAIDACPLHPRLNVSGKENVAFIAVDGYDYRNRNTEAAESNRAKALRCIIVSPCTRKSWKESYRKARTIKSSIVSGFSWGW